MSAPRPAPPKPVRPPPKPKNLKFVRAVFTYKAKEADELSFNEGDLVYILDDASDTDWYRARCRGQEGLIPSNYLTKPSQSGPSELYPMQDACRRGNMSLLEECLLNRLPVNSADAAGNTPLHCAAHAGQLECLQKLLGVSQVTVSLKNRLGDTPLHQAAWKGHAEVVKRLRLAGADLEARNEEGKTATDLARDPETMAELERWANEGKNEAGDRRKFNVEDYGESEEEEE